MLRFRGQFSLMCGALVTTSALAGPRAAYLATLGATPLRFQSPPRAELITVALPPPPPLPNAELLADLKKVEAQSLAAAGDGSLEQSPRDATTEILSTLPTFGPPLPPHFATTQNPADAGADTSMLPATERAIPSAQAFIELLKRRPQFAPNAGTNLIQTAPLPVITVPVDFQPPTPAAARSSSATYIKGP